MQKVPLKFITAMQSKRLQNCNRYKMIYFIHIALFSPADAQFTLKLCCKRKALLQHQKLESNRLFPVHGNKTSLFATAYTLLHFRGPYRRTEAVHLRKLLFFPFDLSCASSRSDVLLYSLYHCKNVRSMGLAQT